MPSGIRERAPQSMRVLAALAFGLYFNALFTFANVPPTPWVRLTPLISLEVVLAMAALVLAGALGIRKPPRWKAIAASIVFTASLVRYVIVSAPGVMGRGFDAQGDLPHVFGVLGMLWEALPRSSAVLIVAGVGLLAATCIGLNWLGLRAIERAVPAVVGSRQRQASLLSAAIAGLLVVFAFVVPATGRSFARPFAAMLGAQLAGYGFAPRPAADRTAFLDAGGPGRVPAAAMAATRLDGLRGAPVFLIFLESYGATLIEDAPHLTAIAPRFTRFENRLTAAGFSIASSQIVSPTFAGGSWRAHATVLSGVRVGDQREYETLVGSKRRTLVHLLNDVGYRTVAAEPAIQGAWPDGEFYGFDRIYDATALAYPGPDIGWWKIPDQYTLHRIYTQEIRRSPEPVFAKISLIMSHIPYFPIPPYVANWSLFETGTAYRESLPSIAADDYRDLHELSTRYVDAFLYELDILESFILRFVPAGALVIIMGDHQPPKLATHDSDSWAVPVHLISSDPGLVAPFARHGFRPGILPKGPSDFRMEQFLPAFVEIFGSGSPAGP